MGREPPSSHFCRAREARGSGSALLALSSSLAHPPTSASKGARQCRPQLSQGRTVLRPGVRRVTRTKGEGGGGSHGLAGDQSFVLRPGTGTEPGRGSGMPAVHTGPEPGYRLTVRTWNEDTLKAGAGPQGAGASPHLVLSVPGTRLLTATGQLRAVVALGWGYWHGVHSWASQAGACLQAGAGFTKVICPVLWARGLGRVKEGVQGFSGHLSSLTERRGCRDNF